MRKLLPVALVAALIPASAVAQKPVRIRVAKQAALQYWGRVPCNGAYSVTVGPLEPAVNAQASYFANLDGTVTDCRIVMARSQFGFGLRADPAFFCTVFVHEVGHLLQQRFHPGYVASGVEDNTHSPDPGNLMYPFYLGGAQVPPACERGGNDRSRAGRLPGRLFDRAGA